MNKKGFTLIEILAVIIIIGIMTTISIVAVSNNILSSRDATVVDLAKVYAEGARTMRAREEFGYEPKDGEVILIPYSEITGVDIENDDITGYGKILPTYCYVGVLNTNNKYTYYITQVDESYHFLNAVDYDSVEKKDIIEGSDQLAVKGVKELKAPFTGFAVKYDNKEYSVKAVRIAFDATVKQESGKNKTVFAKTGERERFSGILSYENNTVVLTVKSSSNNRIEAKKYTFTEKTSGGATSNLLGTWKNGNISLVIKDVTSKSVRFDIESNNNKVYEDVITTDTTTLYGQFYSNSKYYSSSVAVKGSLSDYDTFKSTGKFSSTNSNVITYDGIKYELNESRVIYAIAKNG